MLGANARKRYFLNPIPNAFYTGNEDADVVEIDGDHLKEDYYAFEWGDALFVALDPFWYTTTKPFAGSMGGEQDDEVVGNRWDWTLGYEQYLWLRQTLEQSNATFKFVFAHHLTGGTADYSRAGAEGAPYCEWGGLNPNGSWGFDDERPGWYLPIHDLMVENDVTIFFHGHDHVFAMEELDGIVYQECPHAANENYGYGFQSNQTDYDTAHLEENSGHLRVTVSPNQVVVDYVRAFLDGDGDNGSVAYSYTIGKPASNTDPLATNDAVSTDEDNAMDIDVLANDDDADGDPLQIEGVTQPDHGQATIVNGGVRYEPDDDYCDETTPDSFSYALSDGRGGSDSAVVTVRVLCVNDAPRAVDDAATVLPGETVRIRAVDNDEDVDGNLLPESASVVSGPARGSVRSLGNGSFDYTPEAGFTGNDSFDYRICDSGTVCDTARVRVAVDCEQDRHCDDGDACSVDTCNASGDCRHQPLECDDADACTVDSCNAGSGCVFEPLDCDDGHACTVDGCTNGNCMHTPDDAACDSGTRCALGVCDPESSTAVSGCVMTPVLCDDGNPCTDDSCSDILGCLAISNAASCDDGDRCTTEDRCTAGSCSGTALDCSPLSDACNSGVCNGAVGCIKVPHAEGTSCPGGSCDAGECVSVTGAGGTGGIESGGASASGGAPTHSAGSAGMAGAAGEEAVGSSTSAASGGTAHISSEGAGGSSTGGNSAEDQGSGSGGTAIGGGGSESTAGEHDSSAAQGGGAGTSAGEAGAAGEAGTPASEPGSRSDSGCNCTTAPTNRSTGALLLLALGGALGIRRAYPRRRPSLSSSRRASV